MSKETRSKVTFLIRMPQSVKQELEELAEAHDRSMSAEVVSLIKVEAAKMREKQRKAQKQGE
jgi:predicted transcriptional regulator